MSSSHQTVSVVLPTYNAARFVERAVASALSQDRDGLVRVTEVIAVDDCSSDATRLVLERLAKAAPRLRILTNERNLGPAGSRNAGIAAATADWIAILDADDAFGDGRLARLISMGRTDIIADLPILYDLAAGQAAPDQLRTAGGLDRLKLRDFLVPDPETGLDFGLLKPVFRRRLVETGAWRYPEDIRHGEDFALYFDLVRAGHGFELLREPHYIFSTRIGALSGSYSPGSVTAVNYRAIAAQAATMAAGYAHETDPDPDILDLLAARVIRAKRQNWVYGWTAFRRRDWRRFFTWFRQDRRNSIEFISILIAKLGGQRGLPD